MKSLLPLTLEIAILAGGLSRRMGRDKTRLRLGRRTLLGHIRTEANKLGLPMRVIRRDALPRCGPLGGVYTALKSTRADAVMFLACDMPFITETFLRAMLRRFSRGNDALFVGLDRKVGFPFVLRRNALATVTTQIEQDRLSLHELARALRAKIMHAPPRSHPRLRNVNTPEDWESVIKLRKNADA